MILQILFVGEFSCYGSSLLLQSYDFPRAVWDRKFFRLQIALWLQARAIWFAFE